MTEQLVVEQVGPGAEQAASGASFFRNIIVFSASNLFYLVVTSGMTFVVPKWLSIDDFAMYRYFLLFGGFAGALHLGAVDGALMSWVDEPSVNLRRGWMPLVEYMVLLHVIVLAIGAAIVLGFTHGSTRSVWLLILVLLPVANAIALSQYALQSVRRFSLLSALTAILPLGTLAFVVFLHSLHRATGRAVIGSYLLSNALVALIGVLALKPNVSWAPVALGTSLRTARDYIILGWSVLVFNLLANFIGSADRFFIVAEFSTHDFAMYSFAGAIFYSIFLVMLSVSKVVFPYLAGAATATRKIPYARVREALLILWAFSMAFYFPICYVIRRFLPRYSTSLPLVRLLLLATAAIMFIQILHANYFRLLRRQHSMTIAAVAGGAATALSLLYAQRLHSLSAMAVATVIGCTLWFTFGELMLLRFMESSAVALLRTFVGVAVFMAIFLFASADGRSLVAGTLLQLSLSAAATVAVFWPTLRSIRSVVVSRRPA